MKAQSSDDKCFLSLCSRQREPFFNDLPHIVNPRTHRQSMTNTHFSFPASGVGVMLLLYKRQTRHCISFMASLVSLGTSPASKRKRNPSIEAGQVSRPGDLNVWPTSFSRRSPSAQPSFFSPQNSHHPLTRCKNHFSQ